MNKQIATIGNYTCFSFSRWNDVKYTRGIKTPNRPGPVFRTNLFFIYNSYINALSDRDISTSTSKIWQMSDLILTQTNNEVILFGDLYQYIRFSEIKVLSFSEFRDSVGRPASLAEDITWPPLTENPTWPPLNYWGIIKNRNPCSTWPSAREDGYMLHFTPIYDVNDRLKMQLKGINGIGDFLHKG